MRNSRNGNVDFPLNGRFTLTGKGARISKTKSFPAGTYRYWSCVKLGTSWTAASGTRSFTVKVAATSITKPATAPEKVKPVPVPNPGQDAMQDHDLPGWKLAFADDFTTPVARGGFPGPYSSRWMSYNGFPDTSQKGWYDQSILSVHDGSLDLFLHTENGRVLGAAPVPLVDGKWGGQVYGRFSVRLKSDRLPGFGTGLLLWSDANDWNDGEIDFPESDLGESPTGSNHCLGNPSVNCLYFQSTVSYSDWHTYTIEWKPSSLTYFIDGVVVASTTNSIPTKPLHWVMQVATHGVTPDPALAGHLLIDWATIHTYVP